MKPHCPLWPGLDLQIVGVVDVLTFQISDSAVPSPNFPKTPGVAPTPVHSPTLCERVLRFLERLGRPPLSEPQEKPSSGPERNQ